jgi:hypothetical protein
LLCGGDPRRHTTWIVGVLNQYAHRYKCCYPKSFLKSATPTVGDTVLPGLCEKVNVGEANSTILGEHSGGQSLATQGDKDRAVPTERRYYYWALETANTDVSRGSFLGLIRCVELVEARLGRSSG